MSLENLPLPIQDTPQGGGVGQITVTSNLIYTSGVLDTAQAIRITSTPQFAGLTIGSLNGLAWLSSGAVSALTLGDSLAVASGILNVRTSGSLTINGALDTVQPIGPDDTPTFAAVTVESLTLGTGLNATSGILGAVNSTVAPVELGQSLIFSTGYNRLDTVQALSTTAYPTFRGLTIGNTSGLAFLTAGVVSTVTLGTNLSITGGVLNASGSGGSVELGPSLTYNIAGQIDTRQPLRTSDAPTFTGLTLTGASGFLYANGAVSTVAPGATLTVADNLINTIQDIRTTASPAFAGLTLGTLSGLLRGTSGVVSAVTLGANLTLSSTLDTVQNIQTSSSPVFAGLTLGTGPDEFQGVLAAIDGQVSPVILSGLTFNSLFNTLSTVQDIRTTASPAFAGLTLGTLSGLLRGTSGVVSAVTLGANLTLSSTLDTVQNIQTSSSPVFAGLTLGTGPGVFQGVLTAQAGVCTAQAPGSSLTLSAGVLNTVQDIRQTAAPTFASLTIGALSLGGYSGVLYASGGVVDAAAVGSNLDISTGTLNLAANIAVAGLTIGALNGPAWLAAGVVQAAALSGNLAYSGGVLDLAHDVTTGTLKVGTLSGILAANSGNVAAVTLGAGLSYAAGTLTTAASQTLSSLTLGSSSGVLCRVSGTVQNTTLDTNLSFTAGTLSIAASPVFTNLTLSIADGLIGGTNGLLTHVSLGSNLSLSAGTLNLAASPAVTGLTIGTLSGLLSGQTGQVSAVTLDTNLTLQNNTLSIVNAPTLAGLTLGTGLNEFQGVLAAIDGQVSPVILSGLTFNSLFNTLSTVQDIRTTASPEFAALTIASLTLGTQSGILCRVSGVVQNATFGTNLTFSAGQLSIAAGPTFTSLTLGTLTGLLCATSGVVAAATLGTNLTFSAGQLSITADPTFASLTLGSLAGLLYASAGAVATASIGTNLSFTSGVLRISSSPIFTSLTLGSSTALLYRDAGLITDVTLGTNLSLTAGQLSISASPTFTSLTLGTASGFLYATTGTVSAVTLGSNLTLDGVLDVAPVPVLAGLTLGSGAGAFDGILGAIGGHVAVVNFSGLTFSTVYNMLSTAQDIRTSASPTFAALTLSGLADGILKSSSGVISGAATTDDLPEGSNLYFTDARANAAFTLAGEPGQILVTQSGTNPTNYSFALPQPLSYSDWPEFAGVMVDNIASKLAGTDSSGNLLGVNLTGGLTYTANGGSLSLKNSGIYSITGTSNQINVSTTSNVATLTLPQSIASISTPTFAGLTLSNTTADTLIYSNGSKALLSVTLGANLTLSSGTLSATGGGTANSAISTDNVVHGTSAFNLSASGTGNVIYGNQAASSATSMTNCVALGNYSAQLVTSATSCILIGAYTKLATVADNNSIVIGTAATGRGSNTAVYGNAGITNHYFTAGTVSMDALTINNLAPNTGVLSATGGVVSAMTTADLTAALAGLSPSFNTLTLENLTFSTLYNGLLKVTAGAVGLAAAGVDFQAVMSGSGNVIVAGNTISLNANPTFNAATVSSLTAAAATFTNASVTNLTLANVSSGLIKSNAGVLVQASANSDYQMPLSVTGSLSLSNNVLSNLLYSVHLYNNAVATVSQIEQWVLNSAAANTGATPTITSGVITGLTAGLYNITLTGAVNGSNQTIYPQLQYQAAGGSYVTIVQTAVAFGSAWMCPVNLTADVRIASTSDAVRIYYPTTSVYGNPGTVPALYNLGGYNGYLNRYLRITYMAV